MTVREKEICSGSEYFPIYHVISLYRDSYLGCEGYESFHLQADIRVAPKRFTGRNLNLTQGDDTLSLKIALTNKDQQRPVWKKHAHGA